MKTFMFLALMLFGAFVIRATAEDADRFSYLTDAEQAHFLKVRQQVFAQNPDLKKEADALESQGQGLQGASRADRRAFVQEFIKHSQKMRAAMLKIDPTLEPVLDKMKEHTREHLQQLKEGQANSGA